ncbi:MAG: hypothetical protein R3240_10935 [Gammaproteobacteria bacterium]|nr:hypothetical protein [Gammaproteobacteria bacterium]
MKGAVLMFVLSGLLMSTFMDVDDHTGGRGARQFMRDVVNENKPLTEEMSLSFDGF